MLVCTGEEGTCMLRPPSPSFAGARRGPPPEGGGGGSASRPPHSPTTPSHGAFSLPLRPRRPKRRPQRTSPRHRRHRPRQTRQPCHFEFVLLSVPSGFSVQWSFSRVLRLRPGGPLPLAPPSSWRVCWPASGLVRAVPGRCRWRRARAGGAGEEERKGRRPRNPPGGRT